MWYPMGNITELDELRNIRLLLELIARKLGVNEKEIEDIYDLVGDAKDENNEEDFEY